MNNSKVGNTDMYHYIFGCFLSPKRVFGVCEKGIWLLEKSFYSAMHKGK